MVSAPAQVASEASAAHGLSGVIESTLNAAKSWVGLLTAYVAAVSAAILAFEKLPEPVKSYPLWLRILLVSAIPILALVFHTIPEIVERRRRKRLSSITGSLRAG